MVRVKIQLLRSPEHEEYPRSKGRDSAVRVRHGAKWLGLELS